jgi:hypothetical protein
MLLAVMDLISEGSILENRIQLNKRLSDQFTIHFEMLRQGRDQNNPHLPFFHLSTQGFWHHKVHSHSLDEYRRMVTQNNARGPRVISRVIDHVYLDEELFELMRSPRARKILTNALIDNLDDTQRSLLLEPVRGWSWLECEAVVAAYFEMLNLELRGERYVKTRFREKLLQQIDRSNGAIEQKFRNISAVLKEVGYPTIDGYKPLPHYQREILPDVIGAALVAGDEIVLTLDALSDIPSELLGYNDLLERLEDPPPRTETNEVQEGRASYLPRKFDFVERNARNAKIGLQGEHFSFEFEKIRLELAGKPHLADSIEHVSLFDDTLGYDIKSYETDGKDRFIEVKATTLTSRYTQFFVSANELRTSKKLAEQYHLYRIYNLKNDPKLFILPGDLHKSFSLSASEYTARI